MTDIERAQDLHAAPRFQIAGGFSVYGLSVLRSIFSIYDVKIEELMLIHVQNFPTFILNKLRKERKMVQSNVRFLNIYCRFRINIGVKTFGLTRFSHKYEARQKLPGLPTLG